MAGAIGVFWRTLPSVKMRPPTRTVGKTMGRAAEARADIGRLCPGGERAGVDGVDAGTAEDGRCGRATQAGRDGTEGVPQYAHLVRAARSSARKDESERAGALGSHV